MLIEWQQFKKLEQLVDIRSASEYTRSHIPEAISLPFPIDLKRLKKRYGVHSFELKPEQILHYVDGYQKYVQSLQEVGPTIGLYCMNGGLRSFLLSKILDFPVGSIQLHCGLGNRKALSGNSKEATFLKGGFSSYLEDFYQRFDHDFQFVKIGGLTGSGKTRLLHEMQNQGGQILDLEKLANHSGSAFGGIAKGQQPNQWEFEQQLALILENTNLHQPIFVEEKGSGIGSLHLPSSLANKIKNATKIILEVSKPQRISNLVKIYGSLPKKDLEGKIASITPRLGKERGQKAMEFLKADKLRECTALLLEYYDRTSIYSEKEGYLIRSTSASQTAELLLNQFAAIPSSS